MRTLDVELRTHHIGRTWPKMKAQATFSHAIPDREVPSPCSERVDDAERLR